MSEMSADRKRFPGACARVSLMLAGGMPVHVVAAWHGHDPAVSLSIYSHAQRDDLRAAGAALFS